jgi:hypothetical protein
MKKPGWVSFFGWSAMFLIGLWFTGVLAHAFGGFGPGAAGLGTLALIAAIPCIFMWVLASLIYAISNAHAKQQAHTMAEILKAAQHPTTMCGFPGPDNLRCDLPAGHAGAHRAARTGPRAVQTSPLGLTGTDKN